MKERNFWGDGFVTEDFSVGEIAYAIHDLSLERRSQLCFLINEEAAKRANEILFRELGFAPKVYAWDGQTQWSINPVTRLTGESLVTHTAHLVAVEETKKK
jgi:hypothetical protein